MGSAASNCGAHPISFLGNLRRSLKAAGFHYVRIPGPDGKMNQFAHASVIMLATSDGRMSEYLSGVDYPVRDVRLALVNESHLKIASANIVWEIHSCDSAFARIGCRYHVDSHLAWTRLSHAEWSECLRTRLRASRLPLASEKGQECLPNSTTRRRPQDKPLRESRRGPGSPVWRDRVRSISHRAPRN